MPGTGLSTYHIVTHIIPQQVSGYSNECILTSFDVTYTRFPCCLVSHNPSPVRSLLLLPPCHPHPVAENRGRAMTLRLRNLAEAAGCLPFFLRALSGKAPGRPGPLDPVGTLDFTWVPPVLPTPRCRRGRQGAWGSEAGLGVRHRHTCGLHTDAVRGDPTSNQEIHARSRLCQNSGHSFHFPTSCCHRNQREFCIGRETAARSPSSWMSTGTCWGRRETGRVRGDCGKLEGTCPVTRGWLLLSPRPLELPVF